MHLLCLSELNSIVSAVDYYVDRFPDSCESGAYYNKMFLKYLTLNSVKGCRIVNAVDVGPNLMLQFKK